MKRERRKAKYNGRRPIYSVLAFLGAHAISSLVYHAVNVEKTKKLRHKEKGDVIDDPMWQWGEAVRRLRVLTEYHGCHAMAKVKSSTPKVLSF